MHATTTSMKPATRERSSSTGTASEDEALALQEVEQALLPPPKPKERNRRRGSSFGDLGAGQVRLLDPMVLLSSSRGYVQIWIRGAGYVAV